MTARARADPPKFPFFAELRSLSSERASSSRRTLKYFSKDAEREIDLGVGRFFPERDAHCAPRAVLAVEHGERPRELHRAGAARRSRRDRDAFQVERGDELGPR